MKMLFDVLSDRARMVLGVFSVSLMILVSTVHGQVPRTLSYQGVLCDSMGCPKPDGEYTITFRLYDTVSAGTALWEEQKTLQVERGLFHTILGDQVAFGTGVSFDQPYWISLQVASEAEMAPRIPLAAVGYSLYSVRSDTAEFARNTSEGKSGWTDDGSTIRLTSATDKVGVGVTNPATKLEVGDLMRIDSIGSWPSSGRGMELAYSTSQHKGYIQVYNRDSSKWGNLYLGDGNVGIGTGYPADKLTVDGVIRSLTGGFTFPDGSTQTTAASTSSGITLPYSGSATTSGNVIAITNLGTGKGIYGKHNESNNYGYLGSADYGVYGESNKSGAGALDPAGSGIYGKHTGNGNGVYGRSVYGSGVYGLSDSAYGVIGRCGNGGASGIYGVKGSNWGSLGNDIDGVYGQSASNGGAGVAGFSDSSNGYGVFGKNSNSGETGVLGGSNFAVKADGDLLVTGAFKGNIGPNNGAPFPRPAFDCGWISLNPGDSVRWHHGIGGDPDNYVVDMEIKTNDYGITNFKVGYDESDIRMLGVYWYNLDADGISIQRSLNELAVAKIRVRIWAYN